MDALSTELEKSAVPSSFDSLEKPYVGRWNRLVSTTNWEKGRIVQEWREALLSAGAPAADYSNETWSSRVGGVSGQHVGRLRRVYQRFGATQQQYGNLFWSHFQAAIDWDDAEMWLEGAMRNEWSVADMRRTRSETLGSLDVAAQPDDLVASVEIDEDFVPEGASQSSEGTDFADYREETLVAEGPDFGDDSEEEQGREIRDTAADSETISFVRPFEKLAELPPDFADAFESFKLTILRHKSEGWKQISRDDVLGALDALKELTIAPSAEASPF